MIWGRLFLRGDVNGITFRGEAYTTSYQYYRVYVWIDGGYNSTIVGNTVTDPLQNAKIEITWSEESMVQQVSGDSVANTLEAGLYDEDGNLTYTWNQLLINGDITVSGTTIIDSNRELTGELVIPEGITEIGKDSFGTTSGSKITSVIVPASVTTIGNGAFALSSLGSITFAENSQLTTIEGAAFELSYISDIELPSGVTYIGYRAFSYSPLSVTFKGMKEEWNAIEKEEGWNADISVTTIQCTDGTINL